MSFESFRNSVGNVDALQVLNALWRGTPVPDDVLQEAMPELQGRLRYAFTPVAPFAPSIAQGNHDEHLQAYIHGEIDASVLGRYGLKLLSLWNSDFESKDKRPFVSMERTDGKGFFSLWELLALQAVDRDQVKNGNNLIARSPEKGARTKVKTGGTKEGPRWQIWVEISRLGCITEQRSARTNVDLGIKAAYVLSRWWYMFVQDVTDTTRNPHQLGRPSGVPDLRHVYFVGLIPMRRGSLAFTVVLASGGHISTPAIQVYNTTALHLLPQDEAASCNLAGRSSIPWPPMQGPPMHPHTGLQDILGLQRGLPVGNPSHYGDVLPRSSGGSITSNGPPTQESTRILPSSNPSTGNCIQNERVTDQAGQFVKTEPYPSSAFTHVVSPAAKRYAVNFTATPCHDQTSPWSSSSQQYDGESYRQNSHSMTRVSATRSTISMDQTRPTSYDDSVHAHPGFQTDAIQYNNMHRTVGKSRRLSPLPSEIVPLPHLSRRSRRPETMSNSPSTSAATFSGTSASPCMHPTLENLLIAPKGYAPASVANAANLASNSGGPYIDSQSLFNMNAWKPPSSLYTGSLDAESSSTATPPAVRFPYS